MMEWNYEWIGQILKYPLTRYNSHCRYCSCIQHNVVVTELFCIYVTYRSDDLQPNKLQIITRNFKIAFKLLNTIFALFRIYSITIETASLTTVVKNAFGF